MSITNLNIQVVARLGQDAKYNKVGEKFAIYFSLPITEKRGESNFTSWLNFTYWSKSDKILQFLTKGKLVSVVSDFYTENEKDGKKYHSFRVREINPFLEKNENIKGNFTEKKDISNNVIDELLDDDLLF